MKLGYIGLGKMGFNMVERLLEKGHEVVVTNRSSDSIDNIASKGAIPAYNTAEFFEKLSGSEPKIIWIMVPWQAVDDILGSIAQYLKPGDIVIDGGNSPYFETVRRAEEMTSKEISYVDVGVSGGPGGARNGACLMVGGKKSDYEKLTQLFSDLSVENGYGYMGDHGAGHFVKMVHNGIEYGMMQAIGEGFEVMKKAEFNIDLPAVAKIYNHGSVVESRLIGWLGQAYEKYSPELEGVSGEIAHSGEGQWTVDAAEKLNVPVPVINDSLEFRKKSVGNPSYTGKVVSALRNMFGGHDVAEK